MVMEPRQQGIGPYHCGLAYNQRALLEVGVVTAKPSEEPEEPDGLRGTGRFESRGGGPADPSTCGCLPRRGVGLLSVEATAEPNELVDVGVVGPHVVGA